MVLLGGLKLVTSGASVAGQVQLLPVPGATCCELQSVLQMITICAGLKGAWERLSCEPRPAATSTRFEAAQKQVLGTLRLDAAFGGL